MKVLMNWTFCHLKYITLIIMQFQVFRFYFQYLLFALTLGALHEWVVNIYRNSRESLMNGIK